MDVFLDNPTSVEATLSLPWGTVTTNGVITQRICPLCNAIVPAAYSNAHEVPGSPQQRHGDVHRVIAQALADLKNKSA